VAQRRLLGDAKVARVLAASIPPLERIDVAVEPRVVNGQQGASSHDRDGRLITTWTLDILDGQIHMVRAVLNPTSSGTWARWRTPGRSAREAEQARRGRGAAARSEFREGGAGVGRR
jgi:RNA polymerase sigma-70 factor, ECF subfamily